MKNMSKEKNNYMNKIFLVGIFLVITLLFFYYNVGRITGFNAFDVSIKERIQGNILLNYNSTVNLTEMQNITVEFINTGSTNYSARIELTIYMYNNTSGSLESLATYYDSSVFLNPSERRIFNTVFLPNQVGVYYIKARVPYGFRLAEIWGSFFVTWSYNIQPQVIHVVTSYGGGTIPAQKESIIVNLDLSYKNKYDLYPGQKVLIDVTANNTGTINLHGLKLFSSTTQYINFDVNPKEIYELESKESKIFLISLELSKDIPPGEYDFFFEMIGQEIRKSGTIKLNVTSVAQARPLKEEVNDTILNYEYLIVELDHEIYLATLEGFNTTRAEGYLDDARKNLEKAKELFNEGKYDEARDILDLVKRDLEKVVFELATISFKVYYYPAYSPFLILILLLMIIIGLIIFYLLYRKRKKKKPKIIKEFTEEET